MNTVNRFTNYYNHLSQIMHGHLLTWCNSNQVTVVVKSWNNPLAIAIGVGVIAFIFCFVGDFIIDGLTDFFRDHDWEDLILPVLTTLTSVAIGGFSYTIALIFFGLSPQPTAHVQHVERTQIVAVAKEYPYATTINHQTLLTKEKPQLQLNKQISGIAITSGKHLQANPTTETISQYGKCQSTKACLNSKVKKLNNGGN